MSVFKVYDGIYGGKKVNRDVIHQGRMTDKQVATSLSEPMKFDQIFGPMGSSTMTEAKKKEAIREKYMKYLSSKYPMIKEYNDD